MEWRCLPCGIGVKFAYENRSIALERFGFRPFQYIGTWFLCDFHANCQSALSIWLTYKIECLHYPAKLRARIQKFNFRLRIVFPWASPEPNYCMYIGLIFSPEVNMTVEIGARDASGIQNGYKSETIANNRLFINIKYDNAIGASFMRSR